MIRSLIAFSMSCFFLTAADWHSLLSNGKLDGWQVQGDGLWTLRSDGTLVGQRTPDLRKMLAPGDSFSKAAEFTTWLNVQSWLYTTRNDFANFDLKLDYWTKTHGNSGISIRDSSKAAASLSAPVDYRKTPSKIGYEIQINNKYPDPHPSGSIYGFADAITGVQRDDDWNIMEISSRPDKITVKLNDKVVAEHAGDPKRPKIGPLGLQLHDQFSIVMFRNIEIRELP